MYGFSPDRFTSSGTCLIIFFTDAFTDGKTTFQVLSISPKCKRFVTKLLPSSRSLALTWRTFRMLRQFKP